MKIDKPLQITEELRTQLKKPIGNLIQGNEENLSQAVQVIKESIHPGGVNSVNNAVVTVGDIVTKSFNEAKLAMDIAIVDFVVKRVETFKNLSEIGFAKNEPDIVVENPKGNLTPEAFTAVEESFQQGQSKPYIIRVVGEEDLLTLVVILAAPIGTHVFYGQPNEGIVDVEVTQSKKSEVQTILAQFTPR